jgi:hypothetical protein
VARQHLLLEYFHGANGAGPGASHQTGWTGLVAEAKAGILWVDQVGNRRSYWILTRNFLVENSTNTKLTKFREYLSQSR